MVKLLEMYRLLAPRCYLQLTILISKLKLIEDQVNLDHILLILATALDHTSCGRNKW